MRRLLPLAHKNFSRKNMFTYALTFSTIQTAHCSEALRNILRDSSAGAFLRTFASLKQEKRNLPFCCPSEFRLFFNLFRRKYLQ
jgi:hypothetical protein